MDKAKLAETVRAAQNGDEKALEALYLEYAKRIYYLALKIMRNKEDAEDITQEVFITVCQKISELKEPEAFGLWLNRITANKCTNAFKKKSRFTEQDISEFDETEYADFLTENDPLLIPEKSLDDAETTRMIVEIIDALPDTQRLCVYYYYYEQMTIAQIAEVIDAKENTIKKRLYLARDKIRKELERLDKEEGTKLYTFVPLMLTPILKSSLQNFEMPNTQGLWNNITAATANAAPAVAVTVSKGAIIMGSKAKIAIGVASLVLVAGVIISVIIGNSGNDGILNNDNDYSPQTTISTIHTIDETESNPTLGDSFGVPNENSSLRPLHESSENRDTSLDGRILDMHTFDAFRTIVLTTDNEIYEYKETGEHLFIRNVNSGAIGFHNRVSDRNSIVTINQNGTYSFYNFNMTDTDFENIEISDLDLRAVLVGDRNLGKGDLHIYNFRDGRLYYMRFEPNNNSPVINTPIAVRLGGRTDDEFLREIVIDIKLLNDVNAVVSLDDGSYYSLQGGGAANSIVPFEKNGVYYIDTISSTAPNVTNINRFYGKPDGNFNPIYTRIGDDDGLYLYGGTASSRGSETHADYEHRLQLPQGYNISNIKNVCSNAQYASFSLINAVIVEFDDGKIYLARDVESTEETDGLSLHKELTELNQSGTLTGICTFSDFVIIRDGNLYTLS